MEKKIVFGLVLTLLLVGISLLVYIIPQAEFSEVPVTQWTETYGGQGDEWGVSVVQTGDGGYAIAGGTDSFGAGGYDIWLVKVGPYEPPPVPEFPLGPELMIALAPAIPIVYLWWVRKKENNS